MSGGGIDLAEVEQVCGPEAVEKLTRQVGGQKIYISLYPGEHTKIGKILGVELAKKFVKHFGHGTVVIPLGEKATHRTRHAKFVELLKSGLSNDRIAAEMNVHRRTVEKWRSNYFNKRLAAA